MRGFGFSRVLPALLRLVGKQTGTSQRVEHGICHVLMRAGRGMNIIPEQVRVSLREIAQAR